MINLFSPDLTKLQVRGPVVFMLHGTPENHPASEYSIKAENFVLFLDYLQQNDWYTANFSQLINSEKLPVKTVVFTFDDGYADNYEGAFLPLLDHGMKATWFITTNCIDKHAQWMGPATQETKMLSSEQLKEMAKHGMEIGSHTCSHPDLSKLPFKDQFLEIKKSKEILEEITSQQISSFAYPFGRYNEDSINSVQQAGYITACTTQQGWLHSQENPFLIRRVTVFANDTKNSLVRKLTFADNNVSFKKISTYYLKRLKSKIL